MNGKVFGGYVLAVIGAVVWIAAIVLLILQWHNESQVTMFGPWWTVNTAVLMIGSAVGGLVLYWTARLLVIGIRRVRRGRIEAAALPQASAPSPLATAKRSEAGAGGEKSGENPH